jgi:hypothetical protein
VSEDVNNACLGKVVDEVEYVFAHLLDFAVNCIIYVIDQDMGFAPVIRKVRCNLFAYECARQVCDLGAAGDVIMICYSDQIHAFLSGDSVNFGRFGKALRAAKLLENPL